MEPTVESVRKLLTRINNTLSEQVEGLSTEALNWRPVADSNSIYALAVHMLGSEQAFISAAAGQKWDRDRPAEFAASGSDYRKLKEEIAAANGRVQAWLDSVTDLGAERHLLIADVGRTLTDTAAHMLVYSVEHAAEHLGHFSLTKQLLQQTQVKA